MSHKPTPWRYGELSEEIVAARGNPVASPPDGDANDQWRANAAHIIKCVNGHEALVTALRDALTHVEVSLDPDRAEALTHFRAILADHA